MTKYSMDQALTLSIPEAAKVLGISRYSAYAATRRGGYPNITDWQAAESAEGTANENDRG